MKWGEFALHSALVAAVFSLMVYLQTQFLTKSEAATQNGGFQKQLEDISKRLDRIEDYVIHISESLEKEAETTERHYSRGHR